MDASIERARAEDADDLERLLEQHRLPVAGLRDHLATTLVARRNGRVVGSAALETYRDGVLLRSVAVAPGLQRQGVGRELTAAALQLAAELHAPAAYLLTTTAERYFAKVGFEQIGRDEVPASIQASVEFTSACPSTATVMRKQLPARSTSTAAHTIDAIRPATPAHLQAMTDIYNYYVVNTAITFDLRPFTAPERLPWFEEHASSGRHRLLVATDAVGKCLGYASTSRWRPKPAYDTTVEASVYCHPDAVGVGCGTALYTALFASLALEDVHTIVAGVSLPNPRSISLHERFGFRPVGVFQAVGRKFGQYWDVAWFERPLRQTESE